MPGRQIDDKRQPLKKGLSPPRRASVLQTPGSAILAGDGVCKTDALRRPNVLDPLSVPVRGATPASRELTRARFGGGLSGSGPPFVRRTTTTHSHVDDSARRTPPLGLAHHGDRHPPPLPRGQARHRTA